MSTGGYSATAGAAELPGQEGDQRPVVSTKAEGPSSSPGGAEKPADSAGSGEASEAQSALRARLRELKPADDGGPRQQELANAAKILRKLSEAW